MTIPAADPPPSTQGENGGAVVGRVAAAIEDLEDPTSAPLPLAQEVVVTPAAASAKVPEEHAPPLTDSSNDSPATTPAFSLALDDANYGAGALGAIRQERSEGSRAAALKFVGICAVIVVVVVVVLKVFGSFDRHSNMSTGSGYRSPSSQGYFLTLKECPVQYEAFNNCVDPIYGGAMCETCVTSYWPQGEEINNCKQIDNATCVGLAHCPSCQGCDALVIGFLDCYTNRICTFDCPANASLAAPLNSSVLDVLFDDDAYNNNSYPASSPTSAPDLETFSPSDSYIRLSKYAYDALDQCTTEFGLDMASCQSCVSLYTPATVENCTDNIEWTCPALDTCGCQRCNTEYLQYSHCLRGFWCQTIQCPAPSVPTARPSFTTSGPPTSAIHNASQLSPTAAPVMLPPASCTEEAAAFDTFLIDHGYNATRCKICIGTLNDPTIFANCQDAQKNTCRNVGFCACSATYVNGTTLALEYASCRYSYLGCGAFSCQ